MTTVQTIETENIRQFERLTKYIDVLIDAFPNPITRKELAKKMDVSQPAITKVKDRLLKLCDKNALIFDSKLVLRTDETFWKLLTLYFLKMKPTKLLLSNYGWEMIKQMDIHSKIAKTFKEYSTHFNKEDTETMIRITLYNLKNFQITNKIKTTIANPQQRMMLLSTQYVTAMEKILKKLDIPMEHTKDLINILTIRDKLFYLTKQLIWQQVQKATILKELSKPEKTTYLKVYSNTIDFYLRKLFGIITLFVKKTAEDRQIDFKENYEKIGFCYKPSQNLQSINQT